MLNENPAIGVIKNININNKLGLIKCL
jgi:hypothetical protein